MVGPIDPSVPEKTRPTPIVPALPRTTSPMVQRTMPVSPAPLLTASTAIHRTLQKAARFFGGRYGQLPESSVPPTTRDIVAGNTRLRTLLWPGPTPALVLLHGLNNNAWSWARVASQLCTDRMVVALSQRGHGGSSSPEAGYSLSETTQDLLHVLHALSLDQVDLAGHSWGGKVATHFACTHPQRVRSLALADPVPPAGLNGVIRAAPLLITATLQAERGPFPNHDAWQAAGRRLIYLQHWDALDQKLWAEAFQLAEDGSYHHVLPESAFQEVLRGPIAENILPLLPALRVPVLLMLPTFTLSFLPGEHRPMQRLLPQLVRQRIPGDHTFIHTNPLDTTSALRAFLPHP